MHNKLVHKETGDSISVTIASDGGKNTVLLVTGTILHEGDSSFDIIDTSVLTGKPTGLRLDSMVFLVESGLKVMLKYRDQPHIVPLEGRGRVDLDWIGGLIGHDLDLVCKGVGSFFIVLDISKMGV